MDQTNNNITSGSWRSIKRYCQDMYRTRDGLAIFEFRFVDLGNRIEIDIGMMPGYGNRSSGPHETHRLTSNRGGYKICVGDESAIKTLEQAKTIAAAWAEQSWRYISTGQPFTNK